MVADRRLVASLTGDERLRPGERLGTPSARPPACSAYPGARVSARWPTDPALVAQGIEQRFPKPCVGSSILPGGTIEVSATREPRCVTADLTEALSLRAIVYSVLRRAEVLRLVDRSVPEPGPGEVRVDTPCLEG